LSLFEGVFQQFAFPAIREQKLSSQDYIDDRDQTNMKLMIDLEFKKLIKLMKKDDVLNSKF
jgi:hypothetical protein